jgi:hypothetical protein
MSVELFKEAVLTQDIPEHQLRAGDIGTVVERHRAPGQPDGYSLEFFDMSGRTIAVVTVPEGMLRGPVAGEVPAVRVRHTG